MGGAINQHFGKTIIKNTIDDLFINHYYAMKDIIKDIRKYIQEKEKEIHLTDDDIIEMIRIYKMNLAKKLWYNPDGNFKGFSTRTGNEEEEFISSVRESLILQHPIEFHNRPSNSRDGNGNEYIMPTDGKLFLGYEPSLGNEKKYSMYPLMKYLILGKISENSIIPPVGGLKEAIEFFLEEIYAIYKINEDKYKIYLY